MINPHNPDFITRVPWYLGESGQPTLKHHEVQKADHELSLAETDALIQQKVLKQREAKSVKKIAYQKGACKNCGAMTHKEKDCVERYTFILEIPSPPLSYVIGIHKITTGQEVQRKRHGNLASISPQMKSRCSSQISAKFPTQQSAIIGEDLMQVITTRA